MRPKTVKASQYTGVSKVRDRRHNEYWVCRGTINGLRFFHKHKTERDAAINYDLILLQNLKKPVNIYVENI